jgi:hypothetical protein
MPTRRGLWIGSLFLVLAGLFGMHGLASHGPCDMPAGPGAVNGEMALPDGVDGSMLGVIFAHEAHGITQATSATASAAAGMLEDVAHVALATGGGHDHSPDPALVGLCLAILTGSLLALALSTRRPAVTLTVPLDRRSVSPRALGRDPDPPSLTWLSIRRC